MIGLLLAAFVMLQGALEPGLGSKAVAPAPKYDWLLVYFMSYDNNLDVCTKPITDGLKSGVAGDNIAAIILSDGVEADGLRWRLITRDGMVEEKQPSEDITDQSQINAFLEWADSKASAKHHMVVFLDHGGWLDEMCYDERREMGSKKTGRHAMSAVATGKTLRDWRRKSHGGDPVDLLFFQQCGRGSIENLYNFEGVADSILCSQMQVGGCNTYYEAAGKRLAEVPETTGANLARVVMDEDEDYSTYVLINAPALASFPAKADTLATALQKGATAVSLDSLRPCFEVRPEKNYDIGQVLRSLKDQTGDDAAAQACDDFAAWITGTLVVEHRLKRKRDPHTGWCGVSMHVPATREAWQKYAENPAYTGSRWEEVTWRVMPR